MFVSDLRHFLDLPEDVPGPARRMAEHLSLIVRAGTAGVAESPWISALPCRRRPGRRPCPGRLALLRTNVAASIRWECPVCADEGVISGWEGSPFDLRERRLAAVAPWRRIVVRDEVAAVLREIRVRDLETERLVFRAQSGEHGVELAGSEDDFEELAGFLAAEANLEPDRRRRKRLDDAFAEFGDALDDLGGG